MNKIRFGCTVLRIFFYLYNIIFQLYVLQFKVKETWMKLMIMACANAVLIIVGIKLKYMEPFFIDDDSIKPFVYSLHIVRFFLYGTIFGFDHLAV